MLGQAHAGLGWVIGVVSPTSDRRLRIWCTAAAVLPDVDALTHLAGGAAYDRFHHTFGHNVFTGFLCVAAAAWHFRRHSTRAWFAAVGLVALAFASHLLTDMKFSGWDVPLFWPFSSRGYAFHPLLQLGDPINYVLVILLMAVPWALAFWKQVTPFEIVSLRLDRLFLNLFRRKNRECTACGRACNNRCEECTKPVCLRHGKITWRFRVTCPSCVPGQAAKPTGKGIDDYLARELGFIRGKEAARLDPEFAAFLDQKLTAGLKRLDAVPRTHALWTGSNNQPTLAKVVDLCRHLLHEAPDDEEARWLMFADQVRCSSADLGYTAIEPLILRDFASLHWLVSAARWSYILNGMDPVVALRAPFESLVKTVGPLEEFLAYLMNEPDPRTKEAAARCLDLLRGHNPFKTSSPAAQQKTRVDEAMGF
jgi:membrane-bound metal-dependent hydrolase YbcI (DUF457 family)